MRELLHGDKSGAKVPLEATAVTQKRGWMRHWWWGHRVVDTLEGHSGDQIGWWDAGCGREWGDVSKNPDRKYSNWGIALWAKGMSSEWGVLNVKYPVCTQMGTAKVFNSMLFWGVFFSTYQVTYYLKCIPPPFERWVNPTQNTLWE